MKNAFSMTSWHVGVAAEAIAAALFARCGYDVSVQCGANQPEYDLIVAKNDQMLKISVKGSQDGGWGLAQSFIKDADYQSAAQQWLEKHKSRTILCFVQFQGVAISELPRTYLATPKEVFSCLSQSAKGRGGTILYERKAWTAKAHAAGTIEMIPEEWRFSERRILEMFNIA
jgi:Holliday junction resolvase-like predicted endonuclease